MPILYLQTYTVLSMVITLQKASSEGVRGEGLFHGGSTIYIQLLDEKGYTVGRNNPGSIFFEQF